MAGNQSPIFSRVGDVQGAVLMLNPVAATATGYTGADANTYTIYQADSTNGGFVQRVRVKFNNANPANVLRLWMTQGGTGHLVANTTAPQTPTGVVSATSGTMFPGVYYAKVQAIDAFGQPGAFSTEISNTVPATGNNITWGWSAPATTTSGISSYRLIIGVGFTNSQQFYIANVSGTSYTQTNSYFNGPSSANASIIGGFLGPYSSGATISNTALTLNTTLIGEISLPAVSVSATAAVVDIDYPLNIAFPPGAKLVAGIGTTTANGYIVTAVAGKY